MMHRTLRAQKNVPSIVEALKAFGCAVVEDYVRPEVIERIRSELHEPLAQARFGDNPYLGNHTKRVGMLVRRTPSLHEVLIDPITMGVCDEFLGKDAYQLHRTQAIEIGPKSAAQPVHYEAIFPHGRGPDELVLVTMLAIDDFTATNGATTLVPGSHKWDGERRPTDDEGIPCIMPSGSLLLFLGSTWHGGGANTSETEKRLAITVTYSRGYLRQEENQYLAMPPELAKDLAPDLRALVGYRTFGFLGYVLDERLDDLFVDKEVFGRAEEYLIPDKKT